MDLTNCVCQGSGGVRFHSISESSEGVAGLEERSSESSRRLGALSGLGAVIRCLVSLVTRIGFGLALAEVLGTVILVVSSLYASAGFLCTLASLWPSWPSSKSEKSL